jgi:hypothetical protein
VFGTLSINHSGLIGELKGLMRMVIAVGFHLLAAAIIIAALRTVTLDHLIVAAVDHLIVAAFDLIAARVHAILFYNVAGLFLFFLGNLLYFYLFWLFLDLGFNRRGFCVYYGLFCNNEWFYSFFPFVFSCGGWLDVVLFSRCNFYRCLHGFTDIFLWGELFDVHHWCNFRLHRDDVLTVWNLFDQSEKHSYA